MRVLLVPGVTLVSRKGKDSSWSGSSTVDCIFGSYVLQELLTVFSLLDDK